MNSAMPRLTARQLANFHKKCKRAQDGCLEWTGSRNCHGYGVAQIQVSPYKAKKYQAHRLAYAIANGALPQELLVLHTCDNRICVAPEHLFLGTVIDNNIDRDKKGRGFQKLSECDRMTIMRSSEPQRALAKRFGVTPGHISETRNAKYKSAAALVAALSPMGFREMSNKEVADASEKLAREIGVIAPPDGLHHAPACPANLWSGQMLPFGPCNCGAHP